MWGAEVIEIPKDGSCFFTAISMAMNDALDMWCSVDELRIPMEKYWEMYHKKTHESLTDVTPDLVRFMCSENLDDSMLEMYNVEANFRKAKMFETKEQLGIHMRKKSTWGDQAALSAFLKSLDFECGIIIFDADVGGMVRLPEEWTKDKKAYICLRREVNHYNVIRLWKTDNVEEPVRLSLCVTRQAMVDLVRNVYGDRIMGMPGIPVF